MSGPSYCTQLNVWAVGIHGECFPDKFGIPIGSHGYTNFMLQVNIFVKTANNNFANFNFIHMLKRPA
jgi:hypothetical protein